MKICKIKDNDKCSFCGIECETIEHLFWGCPIVKKFWEQVRKNFLGKLDLDSVLNAKCIILGVLNKNKKDLINNIFSICKKYIYVTKFLSKRLNLPEAMHLIKEVMEIEYNIVIKKDVIVTRFNEKWDAVRVCLC